MGGRGKSRRVSFGADYDASSKSRLLSLSLFLKGKFHAFPLDFGLVFYPYFVLVRNRRKCFFWHHLKRNIHVFSISFVWISRPAMFYHAMGLREIRGREEPILVGCSPSKVVIYFQTLLPPVHHWLCAKATPPGNLISFALLIFVGTTESVCACTQHAFWVKQSTRHYTYDQKFSDSLCMGYTSFSLSPLAREQIELILLLLSFPLSLFPFLFPMQFLLSFGAGWRRKRKTGLMIAPMAQSQVKAMSAACNLTSFIRKK